MRKTIFVLVFAVASAQGKPNEIPSVTDWFTTEATEHAIQVVAKINKSKTYREFIKNLNQEDGVKKEILDIARDYGVDLDAKLKPCVRGANMIFCQGEDPIVVYPASFVQREVPFAQMDDETYDGFFTRYMERFFPKDSGKKAFTPSRWELFLTVAFAGKRTPTPSRAAMTSQDLKKKLTMDGRPLCTKDNVFVLRFRDADGKKFQYRVDLKEDLDKQVERDVEECREAVAKSGAISAVRESVAPVMAKGDLAIATAGANACHLLKKSVGLFSTKAANMIDCSGYDRTVEERTQALATAQETKRINYTVPAATAKQCIAKKDDERLTAMNKFLKEVVEQQKKLLERAKAQAKKVKSDPEKLWGGALCGGGNKDPENMAAKDAMIASFDKYSKTMERLDATAGAR